MNNNNVYRCPFLRGQVLRLLPSYATATHTLNSTHVMNIVAFKVA